MTALFGGLKYHFQIDRQFQFFIHLEHNHHCRYIKTSSGTDGQFHNCNCLFKKKGIGIDKFRIKVCYKIIKFTN